MNETKCVFCESPATRTWTSRLRPLCDRCYYECVTIEKD